MQKYSSVVSSPGSRIANPVTDYVSRGCCDNATIYLEYTCTYTTQYNLHCVYVYTILHDFSQWLQVQELWHNLEAVFSNTATSKEFPDEAVKFASIHKRWLKMMKVTYQTKNVLQCCTGGDVPKAKTLSDIGRELEVCQKSLSTYLLSKRQVSVKSELAIAPYIYVVLRVGKRQYTRRIILLADNT